MSAAQSPFHDLGFNNRDNGNQRINPLTLPVKPTQLPVAQLCGTGRSFSAAATAHGCFPGPKAGWSHVQLSHQGLTAATGFKAVVAASAVKGNGYSATETPVAVTYGTNDPQAPNNPGGGGATGSISAGTGDDTANLNTVTGNVLSDLIYCPSVPRTDGGEFPLLMVRGYLGSAGLPAGQFPSLSPANNGSQVRGTIQSIEPDWAGGYQLSATDYVANYAGYAPTGFDWMFCNGVRFLSNQEVISVYHADDSTGQGFQPLTFPVERTDEGGGFNGYVRRAIRNLVDEGLPFVLENHARVGQKCYAFLQNAINIVPLHRPSIAILKAWSPNDGATQNALDTCFRYLQEALIVCKRYGTVPIILIPFPIGNLDAATMALLIAHCNKVRNIGGYQWDLFNRSTDNAYPIPGIKSIYQPISNYDGTHPSSNGHQHESLAFARFLKYVAGY